MARKIQAILSAMEVLKGRVLSEAHLYDLLKGIYKAGYHYGLKRSDRKFEEEQGDFFAE